MRYHVALTYDVGQNGNKNFSTLLDSWRKSFNVENCRFYYPRPPPLTTQGTKTTFS